MRLNHKNPLTRLFQLSLLSTILTATVCGSAWSTGEATVTPIAFTLSATATTQAAPASAPQLSVLLDEKHQEASLYNGDKEMILFHSAGLSESAVQTRMMTLRDRLQKFFDQGGSARQIQPGLAGSQVVIRSGKQILLTIDSRIAGSSLTSRKEKAVAWANQMRTALGVNALVRDNTLVASRGFSPSLSHLRLDLEHIMPTGIIQKGRASWYGPGFHGRRCANGERFDMDGLTAAHRSLPLNSRVRVTNMWNHHSAVVRITDRGPYSGGRVIDLSRGAAKAVGMLSSGTAPVMIEVLR